MILSARLIKEPRTRRCCDDCGKPIYTNMIRLYGAPEVGDRPYHLYAHIECIKDDGDPKVIAVIAKGRGSW